MPSWQGQGKNLPFTLLITLSEHKHGEDYIRAMAQSDLIQCSVFTFLPHTHQHGCIDILHCCNYPCLRLAEQNEQGWHDPKFAPPSPTDKLCKFKRQFWHTSSLSNLSGADTSIIKILPVYLFQKFHKISEACCGVAHKHINLCIIAEAQSKPTLTNHYHAEKCRIS
jgi:hypothetical protein